MNSFLTWQEEKEDTDNVIYYHQMDRKLRGTALPRHRQSSSQSMQSKTKFPYRQFLIAKSISIMSITCFIHALLLCILQHSSVRLCPEPRQTVDPAGNTEDGASTSPVHGSFDDETLADVAICRYCSGARLSGVEKSAGIG